MMNRVTLLVVLVGALISLHWNPVFAQDALGTPTITLVSVGISSLTVIWSTPDNDGGSSIIAYDLRYILSSAGNKADDQWTLKEDIWTSGITLYQLTDLAEDTGYDIQVRAVNGDGDGPWSSTFARTTSDLSETCRGFDDTYDDPLFGCQWHLKNTGQYGGAGKDINIETAWAITKGSGINVAIVDDGLHSDHLDLSANVDTSKNHDYHGNGLFNPAASHGTSVAGIIAAADDEQGIRGVAPDATIYAYNINADPDHLIRPDFPLTRDLTDTAVSNNSYGFPGDGRAINRSDVWENAVERGVSTGFNGKGISYVLSGGNGAEQTDDTNLNGRTNHYGVIAVCAVDYNDRRAYYSERGASLWLCAPSSGSSGAPWIWTTENGGYTSQFGGTSAATAIVSGVVALVRAANMELTWRDVKLILAASTRKNDSGNTGWEQGALKYGSTSDRYSFNHEYGFGVVDAGAAVGLAANWNSPPDLRQITGTSGEVDLSIPEAPISGSPTTVSKSLTIDRYVQFVEFIAVTVEMQHTNFRNLEIELVSPSGRVSRLANTGKAHIAHQGTFLETKDAINGEFDFGSAKHLGEDSAGTWTLHITDRDHRFDDTGKLLSWSLTAYGHGLSPGYSEIDSAVDGNRILTIDWSAPDDNGGSAVTSYDLRYVRDDADDKSHSAWTVVTGIATTDTDTYELTELNGGVEYNLQVRAVNGNGVGPWSESFSSSTTDVVPTVPAITTVEPHSQELVVSWTRPEEGTASLTSYELRHIRSDASETVKMDDDMWTTVAPAWSIGDGVLAASISSLQNDVAYDVQVRGRNAQGAGPWSTKMSGSPKAANQKPAFPSSEIGGRGVNENVSAGTNVGSPVRANDPNGDSLTYSLTGTDAHAFAIVEPTGQIQTNAPLDRETKESYSVTVNVSDGMDDNGDDDPAIDDSIDVVITVADVNEPPTVEGDTEFFVRENDETFDAIYYAQDPERSSTTFTWSVSGTDGSDFNINRDTGVLTFRNLPDFELPADSNRDNEYLVQVRASDGQYTGRLDVTVTVTDVNEPPEFNASSLSKTSFSYAENRTSALYTYRATDPEQATIIWSVSGTDDDDFDISETGVLTFANVPDFEMPADANGDNEYLVTVEAGDEDSNAATLAVTVTVTNATGPEEPTITTTGNPSPYRENGTGAVYTFRATDPQGGPLTWSLEGADANDFDITSDGGVLTFASPPDFEDPTDADRDNTYEIRVVVTDEQGLVDRVDVTITVANDPEGVEPTISTRRPPATYGENGTSTVYTFRATDPQGGSIAWSLGGADAGAFGLSETGALTFGSPPDFENPSDVGGDNEYNLTVSATDEDGHSDRVSFTTTVTDVNEGPEVTRIGGAPGSVAESDDPAQVLARYTATDPEDPTAVITLWSTSGTDGGEFVMNAQGELRFRTQPDHERPADSNRDNVYEFMVRASDGRNYGTFDETVTVSNVEEPGMVTFSASAPVVNRQLNARLADPDGNVQSPAWEWESSPDGSTDWNFISGATSDSYTPAAEDMGRYLRAMVRYDDGEGSGKRAEGITANPVQATPPPPPITGGGGGGGPVNRAPEFLDAGDDAITETTRVIAEDAAPGSNIGEPVAATDPDEDTLTYTVSGDDTASFEIDASTGQLTTATALDHEAKASYTVTVIATDPSGAAAEIQVTITVTEVVFDCSTGNAVVDAADHPDLVADCEALLAARDKLAGSAALNWSEDTPITGWDGVILGETPRRVTQLYLVRKSLGGTIPADLGSLSRLTGLYLHRNELTGPIPPQVGELSSLVHLTLHRNQLSGEVPGELGDLTELTFLSVYGNELTGALPEELGGLSNLRWLYLHSNKSRDGGGLSGPIPDALGDLSNLERLLLYGNSLSGEIPAGLGDLSDLKSLLLHDNDLTGQIPTELGNLSSLRYLWLDDNDLSGPIPSQLGNLSNLRWLSLYGNNLSGAIPAELGNLSALRLLILDRNDLSGAIPSRLGELSELTWLDLNDNDLSGPIPSSLGDLSNLEHLYLHDNGLSGPVPADLGRLSNLTNLWLRDNRLSGQIPPSLGELPNLQRVRIAGNAFTGCIPAGLLGDPRWYSDAEELGLPECGG